MLINELVSNVIPRHLILNFVCKNGHFFIKGKNLTFFDSSENIEY